MPIKVVVLVAPYVGAWIETPLLSLITLTLPVAPYVGAWIETPLSCIPLTLVLVAPYVGAWIETASVPLERVNSASHPTWVRGLKPSTTSTLAKVL